MPSGLGSGKKRLMSARVLTPLIAVVTLVAIFLGYYFVGIEQQESFVNDQAFRTLGAVGLKFADLVNTYAVVFDGATRKYAVGGSSSRGTSEERSKQAPKILEFLAAEGSKLVDVESCTSSAGTGPSRTGQVTADAVPRSNGYSIELASDGWCAHMSIGEALVPLMTDVSARTFDDIILADTSGTVLYQTRRSGILADNIPFLRAPEEKPAVAASSTTSQSKAPSSQIQPDKTKEAQGDVIIASTFRLVTLGGANYRIYLAPVRLPVPRPSTSGYRSGSHLMLCGLMLDKHFTARSRSVPLTLLTAIGLAVLLVIVGSWPVLKFSTMHRTEPITRWAGLVYSVSTAVTLMLVTLLVIHLYYGFSDPKTDNNMEDLAKAIDRNLGHEIRQALLVMQSVEASRHLKLAPVLKHLPQDLCTDAADKHEPQQLTELLSKLGMEVSDYPYFRRIYVFDAQGFEHISWTVDAQPPPPLRVCDRPYFKGVQRNDLWYLTEQGLSGVRFRVDPIYSKSTGEYLAAIARPYTIREPNGEQTQFGDGVMAMNTPLISLIDPVLPPDYGFAVIDPDGKVLFHSDATKNGRENLFDELVDSRAARAAILSRRPAWLRERYLGEDYGFYVTWFKSIQGCPWSLIVFSNRTVLGDKALQRTALTALLCAIYFIFLGVTLVSIHFFLPLFLPCRRLAWPVERNKAAYTQLALVLGVVALLSYMLIFAASPKCLVWLTLLLPLSALTFSALKIKELTTAITWSALLCASAAVLGLIATRFIERGSWKESPYLPLSLIFIAYLTLGDQNLKKHSGIWNWVPLPTAYTFASLALLLTVAGVPCIAAFRLSYDYYERLATRRQQLLTLATLSRRERRVVDRYLPVTISGEGRPLSNDVGKWLFLRRRLQEQNLDRYDQAFRSQSAGQINLSHNPSQWPGFMAYVTTHWIPDRADSLMPLIAYDCAAGSKWIWNEAAANRIHVQPSPVTEEVSPIQDSCSCQQSLDTCSQQDTGPGIDAPGKEKKTKSDAYQLQSYSSSDDFAMANGSPETSALSKLARKDPTFLVQDLTYDIDVLRPWDFLRLTALVLIVLLFSMFFSVRSALASMFLLKRQAKFNPWGNESPNERHRDQWPSITLEASVAEPKNRILVGLPRCDQTKPSLKNSENLLVIDMTTAPHSVDIPPDTRIAVLDHFEHAMGQESAMQGKLTVLERLLHAPLTVLVITTIDPTFYLKDAALEVNPPPESDVADRNQERWRNVLGQFETARLVSGSEQDHPEATYSRLWASCTFSEKVALYGLAREGWPNHKNDAALHHLWNRGVIAADPVPHIVDPKFKEFISGTVTEPERRAWMKHDTGGVWEGVRTALIVVFLACLAALLFFSQKDILGLVTGAIGALTGAAKIIADVRGVRTGGPKGGVQAV